MNDDPTRQANTDRARQALAQSEKALAEVVRAFELMAERMQAEDVPAAELTRTLTAHSQARSRLQDEVKEHDNRVLLAEGRLAAAPLDLEAIRTAIGSRLSRIRNALDEEELS